METPLSIRLGKHGAKLAKFSSKTGLKKPDLIKLAVIELFKKYPTDDALRRAVIEWRVLEAAK